MKLSRHFALPFVIAVGLSGCATNGGSHYENWKNCALTGAVTGGVGGGIIEDDAAIASAVIGAVVGGVICARRDSDGDGVQNSKDRCPGTAAGAPVDSMGCEIEVVADSDGDGVLDNADACPGTPRGTVIDARGCALDGDGDGVLNSQDKCPTTVAGTAVDNLGCKLVEHYTLEGVNFHTESAELTESSISKLDEAVKILKRHPDLVVEVAGHTDDRGSETYNQSLSQRRAESVLSYLLSHGANGGNLTARGYGESQPVAENSTEEGRAKNRRVELRH